MGMKEQGLRVHAVRDVDDCEKRAAGGGAAAGLLRQRVS
jgi:hypothetical protein